jgi:cytidylate kinase
LGEDNLKNLQGNQRDGAQLMIIAIDGPSGAGKGTLSQALCQKYNFAFLDTGLLFRATALKAQRQAISLDDVDAIVNVTAALRPEDFADINALRAEVTGQLASKIAVIPQVRSSLVSYARAFANSHNRPDAGVILDGRDIGTVVCPDASLKFFVTASPEVRAERRVKELQSRGIQVIYDEILQEMKERDLRDATRKDAPLKAAQDAIILDTSRLSSAQVVDEAVRHIDTTLAKLGRLEAGKTLQC